MRIRSIKPEFWTSDDIVALPWEVRLLFIGLWSYVADSGVGRDNDKLIAADLFPLEDDPIQTLATVSRGLASLSAAGLITRYSVDGKRYLHINAWSAHQKIDRPTRSPFPPPTCDNAVIEEPSRATREPSLPGSRDQGIKGSGEQGSEGSSSDKSDHADPDRFDEFWDAYGNKTGRKKCEPAYRKALARSGVTEEGLIIAAAAYADWCKREDVFQKNPLTWLNGEHWMDELAFRKTRPTERPAEQHQGRASQWLQLAADLGEPTPPDNIREIGPRT